MQRIAPYFALTFATLLWAGNFLIGKVMSTNIPPFTFSLLRWLLVIGILLPFVYNNLFSQKKLVLKELKYFNILGFLSIAAYTSFLYWGLHYTTVLNAALLNATIPIMIIFLSFFLLNQKVNFYKILGSISSLLGVVVILMQGNIKVFSDFAFNRGDFLIIAACVSWALYSVLLKKINHSLPPLTFLLVIAFCGIIFIFPGFVIEYYHGIRIHLSFSIVASIIYAALFSSVFAFSFWNYGIKCIGPQKAGIFFNLLPILGRFLVQFF